MPPERVVTFRPRTIITSALVLLGLGAALWVIYVSQQVLTWVLVSIFLALALNPAVEWLHRRLGIASRGIAAALIYLTALAALVGLGFLFIPPLVDQVNGLAKAAPGYVQDLTAGRGPLGFLERKYNVVEKVREAVSDGGGAANLAGSASTALSITKGVLTAIVGTVTILFMTFFMILEGPRWVDRIYSLAPRESEARWRSIGSRVAETVSGYVTGNLLISAIAGTASAIVLAAVGVPYALAFGLLVAVLDLIPLAGATLAGLIIITVAFLESVPAGVIVAVFFVLYQQLENHLLQPLVYGRTVQLSPLAVLIAVLIGTEVAGILGALGAIPIAGALQILLVDWRNHRRPEAPPDPGAADGEVAVAPRPPATAASASPGAS
jgi:predicted PurR-regulated permease PerM